MGRVDDSAFNSSCLCGECHGHMGHSQEEEQKIFLLTLQFLKSIDYVPVENDYSFLTKYYDRLMTAKTLSWLDKLSS